MKDNRFEVQVAEKYALLEENHKQKQSKGALK